MRDRGPPQLRPGIIFGECFKRNACDVVNIRRDEGRDAGDTKERSPAEKAIIPEICCGWLMVDPNLLYFIPY